MANKPVVQEDGFGCGVACTAYILGLSYPQALKLFKNGEQRAKSNTDFYCREIVEILRKRGLNYNHRYVNRKIAKEIYSKGTIVFIKRTKRYPFGHYLCRSENCWMDPWINSPINKDITKARVGFRKRLPSKPIYAILSVPVSR